MMPTPKAAQLRYYSCRKGPYLYILQPLSPCAQEILCKFLLLGLPEALLLRSCFDLYPVETVQAGSQC